MGDYHETEKIADRIKSSAKKLHQLAVNVGKAKQVKEFSADMRKQALSLEMVKALKAGESATAAECIARASDSYAQNLQRLSEEYYEAERVLAEWIATQASFDAARSLLSFEKETIRQLDAA